MPRRSSLGVRVVLPSLLMFLAAEAASAQTTNRVEFAVDGGCAVTTRGPAGHATIRYRRPGDDLRCAVPSLADRGAVVLTVALPPGALRPAGEFPRLEWAQDGDRWVGVAALPAPPAFVYVPADASGRGRARWLDLMVLAGAGLGGAWAVAKGRTP
jgi:hypothetical protein